MAELKCKNCGGTMFTDENNEYAICEYCGAKQKIEKSEAEIKEEEIVQQQELKSQNKKKVKKTILIVLIICVVLNIIFFGVLIILGMIDSSDEDNKTTSNTTAVSEEQTNEKTTKNQESSYYSSEPIEISDLFDGDLKAAEKILEPQSEEVQNIEAYTRYTFNCVSIMCKYGTDEIYSISVDFTNKGTNTEYTVFGLGQDTTQTNWDSALGKMYYQGYDSDGNPVYSYTKQYDENTEYNIEITATSDTPDKITVYKEYTNE